MENSVTMALKHREESGYTITYYYNMLRCSFICRNSCKLAPTPDISLNRLHLKKKSRSEKSTQKDPQRILQRIARCLFKHNEFVL